MFDRDFNRFAGLLDDAFSINPNWKPLSANGKAFFFKALEPYPFEAVSVAMTSHIRDPQRGKFQPTPADLIAQMQASSGVNERPGPEEAWSIAMTAEDENATVVWTEEMARAFTICQPVLDSGDKIGGRMAFKEAYVRLVAEAVRQGKRVKWDVSLGHDPDQRKVAVQRAAQLGQLPAPQVAALLPMADDLTDVNPHGLAQVKAMLANLVPATVRLQQQREAQAEAERRATAQRKAELSAQAQAAQGSAE